LANNIQDLLAACMACTRDTNSILECLGQVECLKAPPATLECNTLACLVILDPTWVVCIQEWNTCRVVQACLTICHSRAIYHTVLPATCQQQANIINSHINNNTSSIQVINSTKPCLIILPVSGQIWPEI